MHAPTVETSTKFCIDVVIQIIYFGFSDIFCSPNGMSLYPMLTVKLSHFHFDQKSAPPRTASCTYESGMARTLPTISDGTKHIPISIRTVAEDKHYNVIPVSGRDQKEQSCAKILLQSFGFAPKADNSRSDTLQ